MTQTYAPRGRGARIVAATVSVVIVAGLTLAPRAVVAPVRGEVMQLIDVVPAALATMIPWASAEQVLNTLLFVPLGAAVAMLLGRRGWPLAIVAGFAISATVEFVQESIPGRVPDLGDVLWNTVGAAIGVVVVTIVRLAARAVRRWG